MLTKCLICIPFGYIFGCFSSGLIIGNRYKVDVRQHGSGNLGTTNVLRTLGPFAGVMTLLLDFLKSFIPILLVRYALFSEIEPFSYDSQLLVLCTAIGLVLGHDFPFYLKFKGGKGIACMGAVMILFDWKMALVGFIFFVLILVFIRYMSVASLFESLLFPFWVAVFCDYADLKMKLMTLFFTAAAFYMHKSNIKRLIAGTENKFTFHKKEEVTTK